MSTGAANMRMRTFSNIVNIVWKLFVRNKWMNAWSSNIASTSCIAALFELVMKKHDVFSEINADDCWYECSNETDSECLSVFVHGVENYSWGKAKSMSSSVSSGGREEFGFDERRMILSATISVLYRFTFAWSSHERVLRCHWTYIFFPFVVYFSTISASHLHATIEWNSVSSWSCHAASFHFRFVATEKVATFWPFGVSLISGSAVMLPIICTLLSELLIWEKLLIEYFDYTKNSLKANFSFKKISLFCEWDGFHEKWSWIVFCSIFKWFSIHNLLKEIMLSHYCLKYEFCYDDFWEYFFHILENERIRNESLSLKPVSLFSEWHLWPVIWSKLLPILSIDASEHFSFFESFWVYCLHKSEKKILNFSWHTYNDGKPKLNFGFLLCYHSELILFSIEMSDTPSIQFNTHSLEQNSCLSLSWIQSNGFACLRFDLQYAQ